MNINKDEIGAIDRIVAFIDILGFGDLVERAFQCKDATLKKLHDALRMISGHARITNQGIFGAREFTPFAQATAFSDSIVISDTNHDFQLERILYEVASIAGFLLSDGILCRGGVATGQTVHDERILFGIGVNEAHRIEQNAVYPRIVIQDDLVHRSNRLLVPKLKCDSDGLWFIDIFDQLHRFDEDQLGFPVIKAFGRVRGFIIRNLNETRSDPRQWRRCMKYRWLANRFNEAVRDYLPGEIESIEF
jgi:hypothetical protein